MYDPVEGPGMRSFAPEIAWEEDILDDLSHLFCDVYGPHLEPGIHKHRAQEGAPAMKQGMQSIAPPDMEQGTYDVASESVAG